MAKFVFPLESLLRARTHVEQQCQRELAAARAILAAREAELAALDADARRNLDDLRTNRLVGSVDLGYLAAYRRFAFAMQKKGVAAAQAVAAAKVAADDAHRKLAEAAKQRKIVEKLRERQHEARKAAQAKREADDLDEVGMQLSREEM